MQKNTEHVVTDYSLQAAAFISANRLKGIFHPFPVGSQMTNECLIQSVNLLQPGANRTYSAILTQ